MASWPAHLLPPMPARLPLTGTCNRCGLCCTVVHEGRRLVCEHLLAETENASVKPLGTPEASRCRVYEHRTDGMPVLMLDAQGVPRLLGPCGKDSAQEDHQIARMGLGQGCSLTLTVQQATFVTKEG